MILLLIGITEFISYQIVKHKSNNDIRNFKFDHKMKKEHIQEMRNIYYNLIYFAFFIWILMYISSTKNKKTKSYPRNV